MLLECGSPKAQNRYFDILIISTKRIGSLKKQTKSFDNEPTKKKNTSEIIPLQGHLKYNDKGCSDVYFTRTNDKNERYFLIDGKMGAWNNCILTPAYKAPMIGELSPLSHYDGVHL